MVARGITYPPPGSGNELFRYPPDSQQFMVRKSKETRERQPPAARAVPPAGTPTHDTVGGPPRGSGNGSSKGRPVPDNLLVVLALSLSVVVFIRGFIAFRADSAAIVGLASLSLAACIPLAIVWHSWIEPDVRTHIGKTYSDSSLGTVAWAGFALTMGFLLATTVPLPPGRSRRSRRGRRDPYQRNVLLCTGLLVVGSLRLIQLYGGLPAMLTSPGQSIPGQFFALILVCSAWVGLLVIAGNDATSPTMKRLAQIGLAEAFLFTLLNSRLLAIMLVAQYQIYMFSGTSGPSTAATRSRRRRSLVLLIAIPCIALVYGLYREQSAVAFTPRSILSWLFQKNLEPIPGAAAAAEAGSSGFAHVVQTVGVMVVNSVPGFSKSLPVEEIPRVTSIVPSGFEQAWAAAGPLGAVILGAFAGVVARWCDAAKGRTPRRLLLGPVVVFIWRNSIAGSLSFVMLWMFPLALGLLRAGAPRATLIHLGRGPDPRTPGGRRNSSARTCEPDMTAHWRAAPPHRWQVTAETARDRLPARGPDAAVHPAVPDPRWRANPVPAFRAASETG